MMFIWAFLNANWLKNVRKLDDVYIFFVSVSVTFIRIATGSPAKHSLGSAGLVT